jgi:hypothetical protein
MKNAWPSAEMPGRSKRGAPATPWTNPNWSTLARTAARI